MVLGTRWHDEDLYGWIMDKDNDVVSSFDVFLRPAYTGNLRDPGNFRALWPEKFTRQVLEKLYRDEGPYEFACTPAATRILMADWSEKNIDGVKEGDMVTGFTMEPGRRKKLTPSRVKKVMVRPSDTVYKINFKSGRSVRCTGDHRWYTRKPDKTHQAYNTAVVGRKLSFVYPPETDRLNVREQKLWSYLAGIIDGEGSFKSGGCVTITQSNVKNPEVCQKIKEVLNELGIEYSVYENKRYQFWIKNNFDFQLRLLWNTDLAKKGQLVERLFQKGSRFVRAKDEIVSIETVGTEMVYALETETGNYIADGYASSNCQYLNDPVPDEDAVFKRTWFHYYDETELKGRPLNKFTAVDPAISLEKEADYTAIVTVGVDHFHNWYILDIFRDRVTPVQLIEQLYVTFERWHPIEVAIENVAFQKVLQYALNEEGRKRRKYLPVVEVKPEMRTKDERVRGLQPLYANGVVLHNKELVYNGYLEDELTRFPRGKHDDIVDALSYLKDIVSAPRTASRDYSSSGRNRYLY